MTASTKNAHQLDVVQLDVVQVDVAIYAVVEHGKDIGIVLNA